MLRKARWNESTMERGHDSKLTRQNEIGEIRTHIGVNNYVHKSRPMEIMKISIHLAPSCFRAISLWFACNERDFSEITYQLML